MRDRRADARQTLQQKQPSGGEALRLPVESAQDLPLSTYLIGQKPKDAERVFRIGRMEHRQPPHRRKRHKSPLERMGMDIGNRRCRRTLYQKQRSVVAVSKSRRLREQSSVNQRRGKIGDRLPLDQHLVVDQVIASYQTSHSDVELSAGMHGDEQRRSTF